MFLFAFARISWQLPFVITKINFILFLYIFIAQNKYLFARFSQAKFLNYLLGSFVCGRICLLLLFLWLLGKSCTYQIRLLPFFTVRKTSLKMPNLWNFWHLRMSVCSTVQLHPTDCHPGVFAMELVSLKNFKNYCTNIQVVGQ